MTDPGPTNGPLRVLLVEDSPLVLAVLTRILEADPGITVVGSAADGRAGLAKVAELAPDVVCTDLKMPVMGGLEFTQRLMVEHPLPILVVSSAVGEAHEDNVFRLLDAGAVDVFQKPDGGFRVDSPQAEMLRRRVRLVAGVRVFRRRSSAVTPPPPAPPAPRRRTQIARGIVAIGASTGGPKALAAVLGALPADYRMPVLVAQHISRGFSAALVSWLDETVGLTVGFAPEGRAPEPGHVYFAPEGRHLALDAAGCLTCPMPVDSGHVPSVDVLFESLAAAGAERVVAILLSGMGKDGAQGMQRLAAGGALTIAQDEETSVVFGMPGEAVRLGAAQEVLPVGAIGPYLAQLAGEPARMNGARR